MEEEIEMRPMTHDTEKRKSRIWNFCGQRLPRSEIVFICQMTLVTLVIAVSLYNLTTESTGSDKLWIALLGSCLGYALPNPTINPPKY